MSEICTPGLTYNYLIYTIFSICIILIPSFLVLFYIPEFHRFFQTDIILFGVVYLLVIMNLFFINNSFGIIDVMVVRTKKIFKLA
jgi:hypothetical protein